MNSTNTPADWDAYIASAPNTADAMTRVEEAVNAGVDFKALLKAQQPRVDLWDSITV